MTSNYAVVVHAIQYDEGTHLGQVANVIGVEQELLQTPCIAEYVLGHGRQRAVALVHEFHLAVAALEYWNALEHGGAAGADSEQRLVWSGLARV